MKKIIKRIVNDLELKISVESSSEIATDTINTQVSVDKHKIKYSLFYSDSLNMGDVLKWVDENEQELFNRYVNFFYQRGIKRFEYTEGEMHSYLGKEYPLKINVIDKPGVCNIDLVDDYFVANISKNLPNHNHVIPLMLRKWYENKAYPYFKERTEFYRKKMDFVPEGDVIIKIVDVKKYHGRCTPGKRTIEYNYSVIKLSPDIIDYLVVHELCHFKELNHKPPFWRQVNKYCKNYLELDNQIDIQGILFAQGI